MESMRKLHYILLILSASTIGGVFAKKLVEYSDYGVTLEYHIWDTAGQERYRASNSLYYKDACIALLIYDITRKDTFQEIKQYWYQQVKENSPENIQIIVCGNKSDLYEYEDVDSKEVDEFCKEKDVPSYIVSAKNGTGINVYHY